MQSVNWNDLRYLLAIKRGGSLAGAARLMGVDDTTVSRRITVLRGALGEDLVLRQSDGTLVLTDRAAKAVSHIEVMERETDLLGEMLGANPNECCGTVRITSVPILINRWLAPQANSLLQRHPGLQIDLIPDSRDFSLSLREADLAVRLARPVAGGNDVIARRIGWLGFSVFAAQSLSQSRCRKLPWIGYEDTMAHLPQAKWLARTLKRPGDEPAGLRVHDVETALAAVVAGIGKSLLPTLVAAPMADLRQLDDGTTDVAREVWLLSHRNQQSLRRIKEVSDWLASLFENTR